MDGMLIGAIDESDARAVLDDLSRSIPGALYQYVLLPDGSDQICFMSEGCMAVWELSAEDVKGDPAKLWAQIHPDDRPSMFASVLASGESLAPWSHQYRIVMPDERIKWLRGFGQPTRRSNGAVVWNSILLDVTEEVENSEKARLYEEKLHRLERRVADDLRQRSAHEIVSSIAHELNQPLAAAVNYTYAAKAQLQDRPDAGDAVAFMERAEAEIHRASKIVRRIRALYKGAETRKTDEDLAALVDEAVDAFRHDQAFDLPIRVSHGHLDRQVAVDRIQIQQVIANLLKNAAEATIRLSAPAITLSTLQSRAHSVISVEDNGAGIAAERRDAIFEPFHSDKAGGLGVGLALCDTIIRAHGGRIECLAAPSGGAMFKITLPNAP